MNKGCGQRSYNFLNTNSQLVFRYGKSYYGKNVRADSLQHQSRGEVEQLLRELEQSSIQTLRAFVAPYYFKTNAKTQF